MTSLEGCPHIVVAGSDLGVRVAADSRSCPVITLVTGTVNGTAILAWLLALLAWRRGSSLIAT
jgi:hypothetical protein